MTDGPVSFTDVQRVLGLFADGISGAPLPIEVADDEADVWPWRASTIDEEVVRVPAVAADHGALRATVLHHAGLTEFGSFEGREEARAALRRDPPASRRAAHLRCPRGPADRRPRRVRTTRAWSVISMPCSPPPGRPGPARRRSSGGRHVLESLQLHSLGATNDELAARVSCRGCGRSLAVRARRSRIARLGGCERTCRDRHRRAVRRGPRPRRAIRRSRSPQDVDVDESGAIEPPEDRPDADADVPRPPSNDMRQEADRPGADRSARGHRCHRPRAARRGAPRERRRDAEGPAPRATRRGPTTHASTSTTSGHHVAGRQLPAWCRVRGAPTGGRRSIVHRRCAAPSRRAHRPAPMRQLAFIRPEAWLRVHHADEGDELDLDAVIEAVIDRRARQQPSTTGSTCGATGRPRDVATAFLVDLSVSTCPPSPTRRPSRRRCGAAAEAEDEAMHDRGGWLDPYEAAAGRGRAAHPRRRQGVGRRDVRRPRAARRSTRRLRVLRRDPPPRRHPRRQGVRRPDITGDVGPRLAAMPLAEVHAHGSRRAPRHGEAGGPADADEAADGDLRRLPAGCRLRTGARRSRVRPPGHGPGVARRRRRRRQPVPPSPSIRPATTTCVGCCPTHSYIVIDDVDALPRELATLYGSVASRSSRGW